MAQKEKEMKEKAGKQGKPAKETAKKEDKPKSCAT
jgi:hypothetical protein